MKVNYNTGNRIRPSIFTTTLLLLIITFALFNFNYDAFNAGAAPGQIFGDGTPGFLPKWIALSFTLTVSFTATPSTGNAPVNINLQSVVGGSAPGTANFSAWWNCADTGNSVAVATAACGALPTPALGGCAGNAVGYKCEGVDPSEFASVMHIYSSAGTYRAKAIVERATATPAQGSANIVLANPVPAVSSTTVSVNNSNFCSSGVHATVNWIYSDPAGSPQVAYEAQIDDDADPLSGQPEWASGTVSSSGTSASTTLCNTANPITTPQTSCRMTWNTLYRAWARVQNGFGEWSPWTLMNTYINGSVCNGAQCAPPSSPVTSWTTPAHRFPNPDFSSSPPAPTVDSPVAFTELAGTFSGSTFANWSWNFGDGTPVVNQSDPTPPLGPTSTTHIFTNTGNYSVTFTAQDDAGACSVTYPILLQAPVPQWKEVAPR